MKRRLFNAGAVVSLGLFVAVFVLWVRSYPSAEGVRWTTGLGAGHVESYLGSVSFSHASGDFPDLPEQGFVITGARGLRVTPSLIDFRLEFEDGLVEGPLPHWSLLFFSGSVCVCWFWWRIRRRVDAASCPACGYDLRGTPGSECPECGAAFGNREAKA